MGLFFVCLLRRHFRFAIARAPTESFSQERWKRKFKNKRDFGKKRGKKKCIGKRKKEQVKNETSKKQRPWLIPTFAVAFFKFKMNTSNKT